MSKRLGFTLTELLVATVLMTIVLTGAYSMFHNVILQWRMGSENESTYHDARLIFSLLERDLAGIPSDEDSLDARAFFIGENDALEFITIIEPMPSEDATYPRLMRVVYRLDKRVLIREEAALESGLPSDLSETGRFDRDLMEFSDTTEQVISAGVSRLSIIYLWTPEEEGALNTVYEKEGSENQLPDGLKVSLELVNPAQPTSSSSTAFTKTIRLLGVSSPVPEDILTSLRVDF